MLYLNLKQMRHFQSFDSRDKMNKISICRVFEIENVNLNDNLFLMHIAVE